MPALRERVFPTPEAEVRLLLLIDAFGNAGMNGRTQLAKTDFFVRYPRYLARALEIIGTPAQLDGGEFDIEQRMIRHRYGPWDPVYFAILGRLRSRRLIEWTRGGGGVGFRATTGGHDLAMKFRTVEEWQPVDLRARLVAKYLGWSGDRLRRFIYDSFPEVVGRKWGQEIPDAP
jgi:hypothetical protein